MRAALLFALASGLSAQTPDYTACVAVTVTANPDPATATVTAVNNCAIAVDVVIGLKFIDQAGTRVFESSPGTEVVFHNLLPQERAASAQAVDWTSAAPAVRESKVTPVAK